jgi:hypothetical protein
MMPKRWCWLVVVGGLVLAAGGASRAATSQPVHLSGLIEDYTLPNLGSWEVRGLWSLEMQGNSGLADFTAALTMERSDHFVNTSGDPNALATRNAHTHHLTLRNGTVSPIAGGFRVSGVAVMTANGVAAFDAPVSCAPANPPCSTLQVDVTGNSAVAFSNVKLTFGGPSSQHFGDQPLSGVVSSWK